MELLLIHMLHSIWIYFLVLSSHACEKCFMNAVASGERADVAPCSQRYLLPLYQAQPTQPHCSQLVVSFKYEYTNTGLEFSKGKMSSRFINKIDPKFYCMKIVFLPTEDDISMFRTNGEFNLWTPLSRCMYFSQIIQWKPHSKLVPDNVKQDIRHACILLLS